MSESTPRLGATRLSFSVLATIAQGQFSLSVLRTYTFDGSSWVLTGPEIQFGHGLNLDRAQLEISQSGQCNVARASALTGVQKYFVSRLELGAWQDVSVASFNDSTQGGASGARFELSPLDVPYVAYYDALDLNVRRFRSFSRVSAAGRGVGA